MRTSSLALALAHALALAPALGLALAPAALTGCGSTPPSSTTPSSTGGSGSAWTGTSVGPAVSGKKLVLRWRIQPAGEFGDVVLITTDETGAIRDHSMGRWNGSCAPFEPAKEMAALTGVRCATGPSSGSELHAIVKDGHVIVLQMGMSAKADPATRKEVSRIPVPPDIAIEVAR